MQHASRITHHASRITHHAQQIAETNVAEKMGFALNFVNSFVSFSRPRTLK